MGFALFMFIGLGVAVTIITALLTGYVGGLHWLLDRFAIWRHRRQLRARERN